MIGSFQGLAQNRLLTGEKGTADTSLKYVVKNLASSKEDILSMLVAQMKKRKIKIFNFKKLAKIR